MVGVTGGTYPQYGFQQLTQDLANAANAVYDAFNTDANPAPVSSVPYTYPYNAYPNGYANTPYSSQPAIDAFGNPISYNAGQPVTPAFYDSYYYGQNSGQTIGSPTAAGLSGTGLIILAIIAFLLLK